MRVIAIDGPAGAGKSTVSRAVAARLDLPYLDTGAMYRAVTLAVLRRGVDPDDDDAVAAVARDMTLHIDAHGVTVDGVDGTAAIRGPQVTALVSQVAANPGVRADLRERQRAWAAEAGGGVIEGRDIGSVVFPDAELKVFLTASPRERARRRAAEAGGDIDQIEASIAARDHVDSTRDDSPLTEADGSAFVDTDSRTVDEVVDAIVQLLGRP
ncbi:MAG: (d)CMP kinase [Acidimicrobiia bacterium]